MKAIVCKNFNLAQLYCMFKVNWCLFCYQPRQQALVRYMQQKCCLSSISCFSYVIFSVVATEIMLFFTAEKYPLDSSLVNLLSSLSILAKVETSVVQVVQYTSIQLILNCMLLTIFIV